MLILASKSPRRKELLGFITNDFIVVSEEIDETVPEDMIFQEKRQSFFRTAKMLL